MDAAIWYVVGDTVLVIGGATVALSILIAILLLLIGGLYHPRFHILGTRGLFSRRAKYGQSDDID